MISKFNVLPAFFIIKIILDFFSPFRELNSVIQLCITLPILMDREFLNFIVKRKLNFVLLYFLLYVFISKNIQSVKIFIAVLFYCIFLFIGYKSTLNVIIKRSKIIWKVGLVCFFASLLISILTGRYSRREFYNFEHVNLLGTYFVFISIFYFIHYKNKKKKVRSLESSSLSLVIASYLTLSTGAFVSQLTAFIPSRYYKLRNILYLSLLIIIAGIGSYYITDSVSPDLHQKIFGSINYFGKEISLKEFYQDSIHQNLELNDSENSGSFTWRIFSYTFYLYNIFHQDIINFLFGSGVESFFQYATFAPHNDFIAIFLDFGLVGLLCFLFFLFKLFKAAIRSNSKVLITFIVFLVLRLSFENVIYSSYVFSLITATGGLISGTLLRKNNRNNYENTVCI
ncbi:hypothetical protein [Flavobacterium sp. LHD-85]|uniref:hypothetical protein n=1 Tax=Flavobacterium sp. LHD-85 TaxID=3071410 RepID=UPI0027DEC61D|nr:hypothetical protein [Flavobacterium sp. LHD-85]MDQ6531541.1 hypothetical protein [Flavobacterium sp. LHD-85]